MQQNRFSVLTGHLNDYPLPDLVGILRHQQKTGRLLIEYPKSPASLFFKDGELVDAQFEQLSGLQAICVAFAQPASSFNFNPLIKPYRRSIDSSLQHAVSEFLGCWDASAIEVEKQVSEISRGTPPTVAALPAAYSVSYPPQLSEARTLLALPPARTRSRFTAPALAMAAAGVLMLGLSALINANRSVVTSASSVTSNGSTTTQAGSQETSAPQVDKPAHLADSRQTRSVRTSLRDSTSTKDKSTTSPAEAKSVEETDGKAKDSTAVRVVLQVENGRVTQASIGNPKPGMEAYEALALRIARQRRFPTATSSKQTVMVKVD